ncbi:MULTISPECIES: fimbrial protein [Stenotrophomonas]|mgnify:CR=1 FL=1|uniref:fimbrial protein n=1 Tax=Stenotrophomonas TaxID=40323 RepID=UPI0025D23363|nr:fimbrial protein [Stenotrophomonas sp. SMYL89]HDS1662842.1 fimbrial protein [Stenotrophomonas maltophilia]
MYVVPNVARALTLAGLTSFGFAAHAACVPNVPSVTYAQTVPVRFVPEPDVLLHVAHSSAINYQCDAEESATLRAALSGLTYVRDINDEPAYELSPDSPLVVVYFSNSPDNGAEGVGGAIDALRDNSWSFEAAGNYMEAELYFYSRGGPMRPQTQRRLGSVQVLGSGSAEFHFELGYEFQGTTCALMDASPVLDPISADALDATGSGGAKDFTVQMDCGVPGRPVSLEIYDATDRSNMSDILAPAAGSSAQGVGLQVLHNGLPLPMGRVWAHTDSTGASERIPFTARYIRLAGEPLLAGEIIGQAVLVANYY